MKGVWILCTNCNKHVHLKIQKTVSKEIIPVFIIAVILYHVDISWMIHTKDQIELYVD